MVNDKITVLKIIESRIIKFDLLTKLNKYQQTKSCQNWATIIYDQIIDKLYQLPQFFYSDTDSPQSDESWLTAYMKSYHWCLVRECICALMVQDSIYERNMFDIQQELTKHNLLNEFHFKTEAFAPLMNIIKNIIQIFSVNNDDKTTSTRSSSSSSASSIKSIHGGPKDNDVDMHEPAYESPKAIYVEDCHKILSMLAAGAGEVTSKPEKAIFFQGPTFLAVANEWSLEIEYELSKLWFDNNGFRKTISKQFKVFTVKTFIKLCNESVGDVIGFLHFKPGSPEYDRSILMDKKHWQANDLSDESNNVMRVNYVVKTNLNLAATYYDYVFVQKVFDQGKLVYQNGDDVTCGGQIYESIVVKDDSFVIKDDSGAETCVANPQQSKYVVVEYAGYDNKFDALQDRDGIPMNVTNAVEDTDAFRVAARQLGQSVTNIKLDGSTTHDNVNESIELIDKLIDHLIHDNHALNDPSIKIRLFFYGFTILACQCQRSECPITFTSHPSVVSLHYSKMGDKIRKLIHEQVETHFELGIKPTLLKITSSLQDHLWFDYEICQYYVKYFLLVAWEEHAMPRPGNKRPRSIKDESGSPPLKRDLPIGHTAIPPSLENNYHNEFLEMNEKLKIYEQMTMEAYFVDDYNLITVESKRKEFNKNYDNMVDLIDMKLDELLQMKQTKCNVKLIMDHLNSICITNNICKWDLGLIEEYSQRQWCILMIKIYNIRGMNNIVSIGNGYFPYTPHAEVLNENLINCESQWSYDRTIMEISSKMSKYPWFETNAFNGYKNMVFDQLSFYTFYTFYDIYSLRNMNYIIIYILYIL